MILPLGKVLSSTSIFSESFVMNLCSTCIDKLSNVIHGRVFWECKMYSPFMRRVTMEIAEYWVHITPSLPPLPTPLTVRYTLTRILSPSFELYSRTQGILTSRSRVWSHTTLYTLFTEIQRFNRQREISEAIPHQLDPKGFPTYSNLLEIVPRMVLDFSYLWLVL